MSAPLDDAMLIRWRRLAQVDISEMQADTAVTELSRAVLLLLDAHLDTRKELAVMRSALSYSLKTTTNLTNLVADLQAERKP